MSTLDHFYDPGTGIIGFTEFFNVSDVQVDPSATDWWWAKVNLNTPVMNTLSTFNQQGTIAHEFGHGMGLAHVYSTGSVMCQLGYGRTEHSAI